MRTIIRSLLLIAALAAIPVVPSHAALLYGNYEPGMIFDFPSTMIATEFTVGEHPLTVTRLGVWSRGGGIYHDTKVAIWQVTDALDPEALVKAELLQTFGHYEDWLFADVVPTTLLANTTYRIGSFANPDTYPSANPAYPYGGGFDLFSGIASVTPGSFFYDPPFGEERGLKYPAQWSENPFLTANAEFLAPVPEPSSALLLALGVAGVWLIRRHG